MNLIDKVRERERERERFDPRVDRYYYLLLFLFMIFRLIIVCDHTVLFIINIVRRIHFFMHIVNVHVR